MLISNLWSWRMSQAQTAPLVYTKIANSTLQNLILILFSNYLENNVVNTVSTEVIYDDRATLSKLLTYSFNYRT